MGIRAKVLLCSLALAVATLATAGAAGLNLETATIADLNAAFASGALTSEKLVEAYLKRIEAYDKTRPDHQCRADDESEGARRGEGARRRT